MSLEDILKFYWQWLALGAIIITIFLYFAVSATKKSIQSPEYTPDLPKSATEALEIVRQLTAEASIWRIDDMKYFISDKHWKIKYLGYIIDLISDEGGLRFSLYFPMSHPDKDEIPKFTEGELIVFTQLENPIEVNSNNPTAYITLHLA